MVPAAGEMDMCQAEDRECNLYPNTLLNICRHVCIHQHMTRENNSHLRTNCMQQVDCFGGGSVTVQVGVHQFGRMAILHVAGACFSMTIPDMLLC